MLLVSFTTERKTFRLRSRVESRGIESNRANYGGFRDSEQNLLFYNDAKEQTIEGRIGRSTRKCFENEQSRM